MLFEGVEQLAKKRLCRHCVSRIEVLRKLFHNFSIKSSAVNKFFLTLAVLFLFATTNAQQKQHKIIFDYAKGDTASFALMIRQATNIMKAAGNSLVEIVCHGPGLSCFNK